MKRLYLFSILIIISLLFSACKSEDVFGDYSLTYSFSSNASIGASSVSNEAIDSSDTPSSKTNGAQIIEFKNNIKPGQSASISIKGQPNTLYSIEVHYTSGPSSSKSLSDKTSDGDGVVSWEWRVGVNTKPGDYDVFISDKTERVIETKLTIISKE